MTGIPSIHISVSIRKSAKRGYNDFVLEIARIYKALKHFADLQGPICYNDAQNKGISLIVY